MLLEMRSILSPMAAEFGRKSRYASWTTGFPRVLMKVFT